MDRQFRIDAPGFLPDPHMTPQARAAHERWPDKAAKAAKEKEDAAWAEYMKKYSADREEEHQRNKLIREGAVLQAKADHAASRTPDASGVSDFGGTAMAERNANRWRGDASQENDLTRADGDEDASEAFARRMSEMWKHPQAPHITTPTHAPKEDAATNADDEDRTGSEAFARRMYLRGRQ